MCMLPFCAITCIHVHVFPNVLCTCGLHSLCFSLDSEYLLCSSDKATVHVFAVKDQTLNKKSRYMCNVLFVPDMYVHIYN